MGLLRNFRPGTKSMGRLAVGLALLPRCDDHGAAGCQRRLPCGASTAAAREASRTPALDRNTMESEGFGAVITGSESTPIRNGVGAELAEYCPLWRGTEPLFLGSEEHRQCLAVALNHDPLIEMPFHELP